MMSPSGTMMTARPPPGQGLEVSRFSFMDAIGLHWLVFRYCFRRVIRSCRLVLIGLRVSRFPFLFGCAPVHPVPASKYEGPTDMYRGQHADGPVFMILVMYYIILSFRFIFRHVLPRLPVPVAHLADSFSSCTESAHFRSQPQFRPQPHFVSRISSNLH